MPENPIVFDNLKVVEIFRFVASLRSIPRDLFQERLEARAVMLATAVAFDLGPLWFLRVNLADFKALVAAETLKYTVYLSEVLVAITAFVVALTGRLDYLLLPLASLPLISGISVSSLLAIAIIISKEETSQVFLGGLHRARELALRNLPRLNSPPPTSCRAFRFPDRGKGCLATDLPCSCYSCVVYHFAGRGRYNRRSIILEGYCILSLTGV
jgi:hypothetical protein